MTSPNKAHVGLKPHKLVSFGIGYIGRVLAAVMLLALILNVRTVNDSRLLQEVENSSHFILFGVIGLLLLRERKSTRHYMLAGSASIALGIVVELIQLFAGGDAEIQDICRDALGTLAFLGTVWSFQSIRPHIRTLVPAAAVVGAFAAFLPPILTTSAIANRWGKFPIIADFESRLENRFCSAIDAEFDRTKSARGHVARVHFQKDAEYSRFGISGPFPDWTGHNTLAFSIILEQPGLIPLYLRIHDSKHDNRLHDRYNTVLQIKPGLNRIRIPLPEIQHSPDKRVMDMKSIQTIAFFLVRPRQSITLKIDDIRLER